MNSTDARPSVELKICSQCVGDEYLSSEVFKTGVAGTCSYCSKKRGKTWGIEELADSVERAFSDHFARTPDGPSDYERHRLSDPEDSFIWYRDGDLAVDAIQQAAGVSYSAASDVQKLLEERNCHLDADSIGEETEFGSQTRYERKRPNAASWHREWETFERTIKSKARFFNRTSIEQLSAIFAGVDVLRTSTGSQIIVEAGPASGLTHLFRARVFQSESELKNALCWPDRELGAPPAKLARGGRMNAAGISVFYGATEASTAIAEVRPPVGSRVAVARFEIIRPLRLLDLSSIDKVVDGGSVFDPTLKGRLERVAFLQTLGSRMSRPVMPSDEAFDYLPTQALADFLGGENSPQFDGIIFGSPQSIEGLNVVLFHEAARSTAISVPAGTSLSVNTSVETEDGPEPDYSVWLDPSMERPPTEDEIALHRFISNFEGQASRDLRLETLRIVLESLEVHHVESVTYGYTSYQVDRIERQSRDWKF